MRPLQIGEPITVSRSGVAEMPLEFHWRGRRHRVVRVEGHARPAERSAFSGWGRRLNLRTDSGLRCEVQQVRAGGGWWLENIQRDQSEG